MGVFMRAHTNLGGEVSRVFSQPTFLSTACSPANQTATASFEDYSHPGEVCEFGLAQQI